MISTPAVAIAAAVTTTAVAAVAVVPLLHLDGRAFLVGVDLDGHHAHHVVVEPHEALHLLHRVGGLATAPSITTWFAPSFIVSLLPS